MVTNKPLGWTTLEEAKLLVKAGLDPNTADMRYGENNYKLLDEWVAYPFGGDIKDFEFLKKEFPNSVFYPCWSLGALEGMLPTNISTGEEPQNQYELCYRKHNITKNHCVYQLSYGNDKGMSMEWHDIVNTAERETMIEAICDMLFWLLLNNHIKNNNNGK